MLLALAFVAGAAAPDFSGKWRLLNPNLVNAPEGFRVTIQQSGGTMQISARWEEPKNGQYALTLLGVITPELRLSTANQAEMNQVGPFVLHSRSRWEGNRMVTEWNTSPYIGQSFQGTWTRWLSGDGREMTLEIAATSSAGKKSGATLVFRRE